MTVTAPAPAPAPPSAPPRARRLARVVAAVLTALTTAALGAALGAWLGWRGAADLPSDAAAADIIAPAAPGARIVVRARHEEPFAYEHRAETLTWLIGDDDFNAGGIELAADGTNAASFRSGLAAQGWRTSDDPASGLGPDFVASKGEWSLEVAAEDGVTVFLARAEPGRVGPLTALGYGLGLAAGALLAFAVRRHLAAVLLGAALVLLLPGTVLTTGDLLAARTLPAGLTPPALWGDYLLFGVRLLTTAGALLLAVAGALTLRRPRR